MKKKSYNNIHTIIKIKKIKNKIKKTNIVKRKHEKRRRKNLTLMWSQVRSVARHPRGAVGDFFRFVSLIGSWKSPPSI
jgi:hypothetical protein